LREEDKDLEGAGSLGRGEPTSPFFETLEYRDQNPERGLFPKCMRGGPFRAVAGGPA
jgi:hypothetical protein